MSTPDFISDEEFSALSGGGNGDSSPDFISDADIAALTQPKKPSVDELLGGSDVSALDQGGRLFAAGLSKIIPGNIGDEVVAGGTAGLDAIQNMLGLGGAPLGDAYDERLKELRDYQKAFAQESPVGNAVVDVSSGVALPLPNVFSKAKGLAPALGNIAKSTGLGTALGLTYGFGGGEGGFENRLDSAKSSGAAGAGIGALLGVGGEGLSKALGTGISAVTDNPTEDQALLQAFRVSDDKAADMLPILRRWKQDGLIVAPSTTETPFQDAVNNLTHAQDSAEGAVQSGMARIPATNQYGTPTIQTKDVFPMAADVADVSGSGAASQAASAVVRREQSHVLMKATRKMIGNPSLTEKEASDLYVQAVSDAQQKDPAVAAAGMKYLRNLSRTPWTPEELRTLRGNWDDSAKWNSQAANPKADAYKALREKAQNLIINASGGKGAFLGRTFERYSGLLDKGGNDALNSLAGAEMKGTTQAPGLVGSAINSVFNGVRGALPSIAKNAFFPAKNPTTALAQAFGETLPQKALDFLAKRGGTPNLTPEAISLLSTGPRGEAQGAAPQAPQSPSVFTSMEPPKKNLTSDAIQAIESGGHADAVSSKGAIGTHQVTPIAFRDVLRANGVDDKAYSDAELTAALKKPGVSKKIGDAYYALLMQRYHDEQLSLAAYNGGPTRVSELLSQTGGTGFQDIAQLLPEETQKYVPKVEQVLGELRRNATKAG